MAEVWKDIIGYEDLYQVSNLGNVKSLYHRGTGKERFLSHQLKKSGYLRVKLCKDGKRKFYNIHRLVATSFIPNPNNYPCVNHKNENKQDNRVENLEFCTVRYNNTYNNRHLKAAEKKSIPVYCIELNQVFKSTVDASRITGINKGNINSCLKGRYKSAGGYHWQYV